MDPERSDERLLALWLEGDEDAFTELMRRHEDRIFALAFRMMGDRTDALDATQETFIAAFRQAHSFRGDAAFATWLYRVGINACKDMLRKRKRAPVPDEDIIEHASAGASADVVEDLVVARTDIARALETLPDEYRIAVTMHDLGTLPYDEIARVTDSPIGTVKSRISRGRRQLARLLEQPAQAEPSKDVT